MTQSAQKPETAEERAKHEQDEQRRQMEASAQTEDKGILGAILGFLKFLFEIFFPGKEAPHEQPQAAPGQTPPAETPGDVTRLGQLIVNAQAIPKWRDYMAANKGTKVEHQSPVVGDSVITSGFGPRVAPTRGASTDHKGVDFGARGSDATPDIVASASGVVLFSGRKQGYGHTVMIGHADGSYTLYGHLSGHKMPAVGAEVQQGQQIGIMDRTGTATGIHLHYEQRRGTEAVVPRVAGVTLSEGTRVAGAKSATDNRFAGLTDPSKLPKLPVSTADGQTAPVAFARVTAIQQGAGITPIRLF